MRINVYSQELTKEVQLITRTASHGPVYKGIRFILNSPKELHFTPNDDDRSAVTFWIPESKTDSNYNPQLLAQIFRKAADIIEKL